MVWIIIAQPDYILAYLPVYIAKEMFPIKFINVENDDAAIQAVVEERADMSLSDPFMFKEVKYGSVSVVGALINRVHLWMITFNPFLITKKDHTLVTYPKPSTAYFFAKSLQKATNNKLIETPFNAELGPLLTQEAEIGLIMEPNFTQAMKNGATVLDSYTNLHVAFTGFCSKKQQSHFFKILKKAIKVFNEDPIESLRVAKKYFAISEDYLKEAIENLRKLKIYSLTFTEKEIKNAFRLRNLSFEKYKKKIAPKVFG